MIIKKFNNSITYSGLMQCVVAVALLYVGGPTDMYATLRLNMAHNWSFEGMGEVETITPTRWTSIFLPINVIRFKYCSSTCSAGTGEAVVWNKTLETRSPIRIVKDTNGRIIRPDGGVTKSFYDFIMFCLLVFALLIEGLIICIIGYYRDVLVIQVLRGCTWITLSLLPKT